MRKREVRKAAILIGMLVLFCGMLLLLKEDANEKEPVFECIHANEHILRCYEPER